MKNFLFSSFTNIIIIISGFIYLIVTLSFSLTTRMQYQLKILPFEKGSVWLGSIFLKLLLSYCSFLIIFAIIMPLLKLFYFSLITDLLILIFCQILFFFSVTFYYLIFSILSEKIKISRLNINNVILVIFLFYYTFVFRFQIDQKIQYLNIKIDIPIILGLLFALTLCTFLFIICINKLKTERVEDTYFSGDFYKSRVTIKINHLSLLVLGIIRNKLTLRLIGVVFLLFSLCILDTKNISVALSTVIYFYPIISFSAIRYYSTTSSFRKMNPFFGLTALKETLITTLINIIINVPLLITAIILSGDYIKIAYYGFIIFESALIMSIVFPKHKSSVNEFSASILCVVLAASLYLVSDSFVIFFLILVLLSLVKYYLITRSFFDEIN
ncbi:hypothetical protein ACLZHR_18780 [Priestia aryabhattai]|uniref:hypothetical protein n=1 Tax=Priestia aryabhattai TaxID=412384 RepID=UPI003A80BDCF